MIRVAAHWDKRRVWGDSLRNGEIAMAEGRSPYLWLNEREDNNEHPYPTNPNRCPATASNAFQFAYMTGPSNFEIELLELLVDVVLAVIMLRTFCIYCFAQIQLLRTKHILFSQSTPLGHLVAVIKMGGVLVAAVCTEGEL